MRDNQAGRERRPGSGALPDGEPRRLAGSHWEWVAAAISFVLVTSAIGFLVLDATESPPTPPVIEIAIDSVVAAGSGYLVEFSVHNTGTRTAATLQVEGTLRSGDAADEETSQVTFDFVPGESTRGAGLFFTSDPRQGRLEIRSLGYQHP